MSSTAIAVLVGAAVLLAVVLTRLVRASTPGATDIGLPQSIPRHYSNHAKERMAQRGVGHEQVELALVSPDRRLSDPAEGSIRFEKNFDRGTLKVWVAADPSPTKKVVIKSTAWKHLETFEIPAAAVGRVIGRQGATIRGIEGATNAKVSVGREGVVCISAGERFQVERAKQKIDEIVNARSS